MITVSPLHHWLRVLVSFWQGIFKKSEQGPETRKPATRAAEVTALTPTFSRDQLRQIMGLTYDPFSHAYSEGEPAPNFQEIFVDPSPSLLERLKQSHHTLVLANYGMGKTATRLAFEYMLRNEPARPPRLCITYTPLIDELIGVAPEAVRLRHYEGIAAAAAIDIVIQYIERLNDTSRSISDDQYRALERQLRALPPWLQRQLRNASTTARDGAIWRRDTSVNGEGAPDKVRPPAQQSPTPGAARAVVRHVATTARWRALLAWIATLPGRRSVPQPWEDTLEDARTLGFGQLFVLVDAIDERTPQPTAQRELIVPLLEDAAILHDRGVFLKCFLPTPVSEQPDLLTVAANSLTSTTEIARIESATPSALLAIVHERLQAASASPVSFSSLDLFKRDDIAESLEQRLAQLAAGSPRRMIELVSALLDFLCDGGLTVTDRVELPLLTAESWQRFLAKEASRPHSGSP